ncbi:nitroreductase [Planctomycetales bacterium]|nr:nitroreductase [Planctomycetales bacterium]
MEKIIIDKYLCVRCGQCVAVCPNNLLYRRTTNDYPSVAAEAETTCIKCNHCVAVCPVGAVAVDGIDAAACTKITRESFPRFEHIETLVRTRRSIRRYSDQQFEDRTVEQLLDVVRWAPSAKNGLPVKWIAINSRKKVRELGGLVIDWVKTLPNMERLIKSWDEGNDPIFRGAPCVIAAYTDNAAYWPAADAVIAVETLDLCAAAKRLGSCWAGFFVQAAQSAAAKTDINRWLGLSENETVQGGLMIGYVGDAAYQRIPHRPQISLRWIR